MDSLTLLPQPSPEAMALLDKYKARHLLVLPKAIEQDVLHAFIGEDADTPVLENQIMALTGKRLQGIPSPSDSIRMAIEHWYDRGANKQLRTNGTLVLPEKVEDLVTLAHDIGASDLHIEPGESGGRIRIRVDGKLVERYIIPQEKYPQFVNQIKIRSKMDISEKRLPQDGRIDMGSLDIRVSSLPSHFGEKIVMRLLSRSAINLELESLGMSEQQLAEFKVCLKRPNGLFLVSGPTGSGKTTTLYACLKTLNAPSVNILTIEDPVEYKLKGITQVQLKENIGLTFGKALRAFLRQDPDIIMLGEIRDEETASMAVRASLTGHLVLSTIHTNSAAASISRLIDMGVEPYLLAGTLVGSVAQRLLRKVCDCSQWAPFPAHEWPSYLPYPKDLSQVKTATGCPKCLFTGYLGRVAVFEVIRFDHDLLQLVRSGNEPDRDLLESIGVRSLGSQAIELLRKGVTSLDEALPIILDVL